MIKAIETVYNGYRFRSRLEARWAVFLDSLGIEYQYEPEGFDLGEAGWYLPDFWLPQVNMWAEVKGKTFSWEELHKCAILQDQNHNCLLLDGPPDFRSYFNAPGAGWFSTLDGTSVIFSDGNSGMPGGDYIPVLRWFNPAHDYWEEGFRPGDPVDYIIDGLYLGESRFFCCTGSPYPTPMTWKPKERFTRDLYTKAVYAARQARFEHGETPKGPRV